MQQRNKIILAGMLVAGLVGIGLVIFTDFFHGSTEPSLLPDQRATTSQPDSDNDENQEIATSTEVIGQSVEGRDINVFTFGNGSKHLLFVGGIHGGYEWNSSVLAWKLIDYLQANPSELPDAVSVSIIPAANPDGIFRVTGTVGRIGSADVPADANPGGPERFNANGVDLNRNFACNWQPKSVWKGQAVDAGSSAFSEPESRAIRDYVQANQFSAGVFFHSAAGAVYGAACGGAVGPETKNLLSTYAQAAGYRAVDTFDAYPVTGDVESWMTKQGIPAVSVELTNHQDVEWQKNLAGIKAVLNQYATQ